MFQRNSAVSSPRAPTMPHLAHKLVLAVFLTALASSAAAANCAVTTTAVAFGGYDPFAGPRDASGAIRVSCNGNAEPMVQLGAGSSGSAANRQMRSAGEVLRYNVYSDAARSQVFDWMTLTGGGTQNVTLYGRIFAGQPVPPGAYQDTLTVSVLF